MSKLSKQSGLKFKIIGLAVLALIVSVVFFGSDLDLDALTAKVKKASPKITPKTSKTTKSIKKPVIITATPTAPPESLPKKTPAVSAKYTENSVGYVGCSNSQMSVQGYRLNNAKNRIWPDYDTGGKGMDEWANPNDSAWNGFDQKVKTYGQPVAVWVQICQVSFNDSLGVIKKAIDNLKQHAPSTTVYISAINSYSPPDVCPTIGPFQSGLAGMAQSAVQSGLGLAGPNLGPLTQSQVASDYFGTCHPNDSGKVFLGKQLGDFFDNL